MSDYLSQFTGSEIDARLAKVPQLETGKQDKLTSGSNIKTINGQSVLGSGNLEIQTGETDVVKYTAQTLTDAQKAQARANIDAASLADINNMDFVTAATLPTASASTMGHIYLIGPDENDNYDRYFTQEDGSSYSWVSLGSTQIDLSTYATQSEVDQLEHKVDGYFELNTIDFSEYEKVYFYISNVAKWTSSTTNYGIFVPVTPGQRIFITKGSRSAYWSPLKSTAHTAGTTPDFATGYSARVQVTEDTIVTLPNDANYLFIDEKITAGLVDDTYQTEDWVDGHEDRIDDLETLTETQGGEIQILDARTSRIGYIDKTAQMVNGAYINTNVSVGATVDVSSPVSTAEYSYIILPVTAGQKAKVKGSSGTNARLWAFTDASYKLIDKANASIQTTTYVELTAPADGYLICNASKTSVTYPRGVQEGVIVTIDTDVENLETRVTALETNDATQDGKLADIDDELFSIDTQDWVFSEKKSVGPSLTTNFLTYLGKCDCVFKIESSSSNYFELRATNKGTGNSITLRSYQNTQASFPLEFSNPRPDLELTNIRIVGYSVTTLADFTLTITKASPIKPLIDAAYIDKYMADMPIPNYKSAQKFLASDYEEMTTTDIYDAYDALVTSYPDYVSKTELGEVQSVAVGTIPAETNKINRYDFAPAWAANTGDAKKIKIMILTGTHPEYMAIRAMYKIMTSICESWANSDALEFLRFNVHFIIIPCASPWAVNHHSRVNANGVDMARNYPVGWTEGTYVAPPSSTSTYGGTEPLCETESQLVNAVFESEKGGLVAAIDFHNHFSTSSLFWAARNAGDTFMAGVAGNFLKLIPRQETKYNFITPYTALGTTDSTNPGGSFGRNANGNGVKGLTFETSGVVVSGLGFSDLGEVLTVSHDGFTNFLIILIRELLMRQYSVRINP